MEGQDLTSAVFVGNGYMYSIGRTVLVGRCCKPQRVFMPHVRSD